MKERENNVVWHKPTVTRQMRESLNSHRSVAVWFTGLPSSGKSTIANAVEEVLYRRGIRTYTFDGDNIRHGLCSDLGFSAEDRAENLRRIAEVTKLFLDAGVVVLAAFVSPFRKDRQRIRTIISEQDFVEIYCRCPVDVCIKRDLKGMYKKALAGELKNYTGISSPYEEPESPDLILDTHILDIDETV
ncbi:MAG TPA: adenylyl-sulfate kinase, partial [Thermodesulfovibrio thiophilus]|nr:adenylyl-sulfate kinase [Thermodesulfovibrio thiophilus]HQD37061.1 adenylyl-sulfate kinase [Thermodesulfovibrio thiophilus]